MFKLKYIKPSIKNVYKYQNRLKSQFWVRRRCSCAKRSSCNAKQKPHQIKPRQEDDCDIGRIWNGNDGLRP
jgi:hypothetical protein